VRLWSIFLAVCLWLGPAAALAQPPGGPARDPVGSTPDRSDDEARSLFDAGRIAFSEGRYEDALERFEAAYGRSQRPELLYNIGMCADRLRLDARALEACEAFLAAVPDAPNRDGVEARVAAIRQALAEREALVAATREPAEPVEPAPPVSSEGSSVLEAWWFWTLVGLAVAGGVTASVLGVTLSDRRQDPIPGDYGAVVRTVVVRTLGTF
jgi:tetratricopeptide (TPR) repeat protein